MSRKKEIKTVRSSVLEYVYVLVGAAIIALSFNLFLLPNNIASGGVSGVSVILNHLFDWKPAYVQYALNIPLFIGGVLLLGKKFGLKTLIGTLFLPLVIDLTEGIQPWTNEPLLAALFGGIMVGLGLGIVFKGRASTGGTDTLAQIIHKFTGLSLGKCVALIDGMVVISAAVVFDIEGGLYALIALFATSKTIDLVQVGVGGTKLTYIISNKQDEIKQAILNDIDRGVTKLTAKGGYTDEDRPILMCVVENSEFTNLKQVVKNIDEDAFIIVTDASEVLGTGFKKF